MERTKLNIYDLTPEQKVEHGMDLLDLIFGKGWPLLMDVKTFNIMDGNRCVLGQIANSVVRGNPREPITGSHDNGYGLVRNELQNINGAVQDYLFEHFVWSDMYEDTGEVIDHVGGFEGDRSTNDLWKKAIRKRQRQLGGHKAVQRARRRLAEMAPQQEENEEDHHIGW